MSNKNFVYISYINTTPQQLWDALTRTEFISQFWGADGRSIESDWKAGSPVTLRMGNGEINWQGTVLQCEPPKLLSFTFHGEYRKELRDEAPSKVTYTIEPRTSGVKFTVLHEELTERMLGDISEGWPYIVSALKSLLETGTALL